MVTFVVAVVLVVVTAAPGIGGAVRDEISQIVSALAGGEAGGAPGGSVPGGGSGAPGAPGPQAGPGPVAPGPGSPADGHWWDWIGTAGDVADKVGEGLQKFDEELGDLVEDAFRGAGALGRQFGVDRFDDLARYGDDIEDFIETHGKMAGTWLKRAGPVLGALGAGLTFADYYYGQDKSFGEALGRTTLEAGGGFLAGAGVLAACGALGVATAGAGFVACGAGAVLAGIAGGEIGGAVGDWVFGGGPGELISDVGDIASDAWAGAGDIASDAWEGAGNVASDVGDAISFWD